MSPSSSSTTPRCVYVPATGLILSGVAHSCRNDGDETAVLIGVVIGAHHKGVPLRTTTA